MVATWAFSCYKNAVEAHWRKQIYFRRCSGVQRAGLVFSACSSNLVGSEHGIECESTAKSGGMGMEPVFSKKLNPRTPFYFAVQIISLTAEIERNRSGKIEKDCFKLITTQLYEILAKAGLPSCRSPSSPPSSDVPR
jgi:hypothetical protein